MVGDFPVGAVAVFTLCCVAVMLAFAEGLSQQKAMRQDIKEIRDAVHSVARKAGERITELEVRVEQFASCPTKDRRAADRRSPDDWVTDSNFKRSGDQK